MILPVHGSHNYYVYLNLIGHSGRVDHSQQLIPGWFVGTPLELSERSCLAESRTVGLQTAVSQEPLVLALTILLMGFIAHWYFNKIFSLLKRPSLSFSFIFIINTYTFSKIVSLTKDSDG